jgi:cytoskeletal protein CcmA (bactofilin family)
MVLNEAIGNSTLSKSTGSLIIKHQNVNGVSSIVFPSSTPTDGGDYGYIKYIDDINNNAAATVPYGGESSRLVIGVENDATGDTIADKIVLMTPSSNGCVGINKMTPMCALDVSGNGCISGSLGINNSNPSCALDVTGSGKISGTLTTNNLVVNGTISGGFTFGDITTAKISNSGSITTGSLSSTGSITGDYFKVGDD